MNWEDRKKLYNEKYLERQGLHNGHNATHAQIAKEIIDLFAPQRVLDCGCANGFLINQLALCGIESYGVDINQAAIDDGRAKYPLITLLCLDMAIEKLPFDNRYFDLVIAREFIEHIDDEHLFFVIGEILRVTSKWMSFETPMVQTGAQTDWRDWLRERNAYPLVENLELIDKHPYLVSEYPHPENQEHPNTHCREFWIGLFNLMGFEVVYFSDEHYAPLRYDGICGLNILHLQRKREGFSSSYAYVNGIPTEALDGMSNINAK